MTRQSRTVMEKIISTLFSTVSTLTLIRSGSHGMNMSAFNRICERQMNQDGTTRHGRHSLTIHSDHQVKRRQYFRLGWIALVHFLNSVIHSLFNIQFLSLDFHHLDKVMVVEIEYWNVHFPHSVTHLFIYIIYIYKSADSFWYKIEFKSENSSGIRVCSSNFFIISVWFDLFFFLDSSDEQSADTTIQWSS